MIKGTNKYEKLAEPLRGIYTLETFAEKLRIDKTRAIYILHRLRKLGFVKTTYGAGKKRIYTISLKNKSKAKTPVQKINESVKKISFSYALAEPSNPNYIHGREPTYEESLIYAIKQKDTRYLIAALPLFRKITDWNLLYRMAKKENLLQEVAALYEVAKKTVRKIRRMPKSFINRTIKKTAKFKYIIEPLSSDDFKDIEKKWKVFIPLNLSDLEEYSND